MTYGQGNRQGAQKGVGAYTKTQVSTTATQQELIVMAYEGIIRFLMQAKQHMADGDFEQKHTYICKARAVIEELASTLNRDEGGEIAANLWNLYMFFLQKITEANFKNDPKPIDEILPSIQDLRDGWAQMEIPKDDVRTQQLNKRQPAEDAVGRVTITG